MEDEKKIDNITDTQKKKEHEKISRADAKLALRGSLRDYFYNKFENLVIEDQPHLFLDFITQKKEFFINFKYKIICDITNTTIEKEYLNGIYNTVLNQVFKEYESRAKKLIEEKERIEQIEKNKENAKKFDEYIEKELKEKNQKNAFLLITLLIIHTLTTIFILFPILEIVKNDDLRFIIWAFIVVIYAMYFLSWFLGYQTYDQVKKLDPLQQLDIVNYNSNYDTTNKQIKKLGLLGLINKILGG